MEHFLFVIVKSNHFFYKQKTFLEHCDDAIKCFSAFLIFKKVISDTILLIYA